MAAFLWILNFQVRPLNFWVMMSLSTLVLLLVALLINRDNLSFSVDAWSPVLGVLSGIALYGFFYVGFQLTRSSPLFQVGVSNVYELRSSMPNFIIGSLLVFPIAPAEEFYWRGLIQRRIGERLGSETGLLLATSTYALVHLPTLNLPLILTALIGGIVWGYMYSRLKRLGPVILSHVIFDLLIFVIAPFS